MLKRKFVICYVLCGLLFCGCANMQSNPRAEYLASLRVFTATVDSLAQLQRAGKFSDTETARVLAVIEQGREYFNLWEPAAGAGQPRPDIAGAVSAILDELLAIELAKDGGD